MKVSEHEDANRSLADGVTDGKVDSNDPGFYLATNLTGLPVATYFGTDAKLQGAVSPPRRGSTRHDGQRRPRSPRPRL